MGINLFAGLILSPYIIRKLGVEGYGVWALVFSLVGYYGLMDLGFRAAVIRFTAHYAALEQVDRINQMISTLLTYLAGLAMLLLGATMLLANHAHRFFKVSAAYQDEMGVLILIVGASLSFGLVFNVFSGFIEGLQRFDLANQVRIVALGVRTGGAAVLLALGFGLVALGIVTLVSQALMYVQYTLIAKRVYPRLRYSIGLVNRAVIREVARYGVPTFVASLASQSLEQTPSLVIGNVRSVESVTYYTVPYRLILFVADALSRIGLVAAPKAAELAGRGREGSVRQLATYSNRYCFALFVPFAIWLLLFGQDFLVVWVGPKVAAGSGLLLPFLTAAIGFAIAGQTSSSAILFGLSRHQFYAYGLLVEAVASAVGLFLVIPSFGVLGAAVVTAVLMVAVRGVYTPWLMCHYLRISYPGYLLGIYLRPTATALPVYGLGVWLKANVLAGAGWVEVTAGGIIVSLTYLTLALYTSVEREHRELLRDWLFRHWKPGRMGET
jgi:O-antigen/teichoic acid export membrane protein